MMQLTYRYRLYPSRGQEEKLLAALEFCRWLYNRLLEEMNRAKAEDKKITQLKTQALIVKLKEEKPELKTVYSKVLQMVNHQLWNNISALAGLKRNGRRVGRLRFKGEDRLKALNYNQSGFKVEGKKLVLSKVGEVPIKLHREIKGKVKGVIVKREGSGRWYAMFQVENETEPLPKTRKAVGIDVGIKHFLTDSEGQQVENPRFYERTLERIRIRHKQLSRKQEGSENHEKAKAKLLKIYEKLVNRRDDFLHKLSRFYVNNYDVIAVENLNIAAMARNHNLAQYILDTSWGKFLHFLSYKAEGAGRRLVEVDPKGTSQEYKNREIDRDYNAALNILKRGLVGRGWPEPTPVEMEPLRELIEVSASSVVEAGSPLR